MNRIVSPIILGIVYVIMCNNVLFGGVFDSEDIPKLLIIIIINIIDIMIPIVRRVVFDVDNKKVISISKVILNIFMLLTTIVLWGEVKYDHYSSISSLCCLFLMLWLILRIILAIIEVIMIVSEKQIKKDSNEKNKNSIIKPIIQLIGYIILVLVIAIFDDNGNGYLIIFMPIIMFILIIIDSIMLATNKKKINLIKFIISVIMILTTMGSIILVTDLFDFIILEGIVQIVLNIIEIITIIPVLRRNIKKISIVTLSIVIVCIIGVSVNTVELEYNIYPRDDDYYWQVGKIITSRDEFEKFIDKNIRLLKYEYKYEMEKFETYKQKYKQRVINVISELEIDEQFFDKYNVIYGTYARAYGQSIRSIKYNRIKNKIIIEYNIASGIISPASDHYEYFIKIDKKIDKKDIAEVEWKGVSGFLF